MAKAEWIEVALKLRYRPEVLVPGGEFRDEPETVQDIVDEIDRAVNASHFGGQVELEIVKGADRREWTDEDDHRLSEATLDRDQFLALAKDGAEALKDLIKSHRKVCIALAKFAGNPEPPVTVQIMEMAGDVDREVEPHELKTFEFDTQGEASAFEMGISTHNHMVV